MAARRRARRRARDLKLQTCAARDRVDWLFRTTRLNGPHGVHGDAASPLLVRLHEIDVAHAECLGDLVEADDGRVALAALEPAQVLLAEA